MEFNTVKNGLCSGRVLCSDFVCACQQEGEQLQGGTGKAVIQMPKSIGTLLTWSMANSRVKHRFF